MKTRKSWRCCCCHNGGFTGSLRSNITTGGLRSIITTSCSSACDRTKSASEGGGRSTPALPCRSHHGLALSCRNLPRLCGWRPKWVHGREIGDGLGQHKASIWNLGLDFTYFRRAPRERAGRWRAQAREWEGAMAGARAREGGKVGALGTSCVAAAGREAARGR